jgi:hypothetical protein
MRPARQKILDEVRRIKSTTPCADCEKTYPYWVVQFDHVRGIKIDKVNRMVYTSSYEKVMEEISKCEVVCANCHHDRTFQRSLNLKGLQDEGVRL